MQDLSTGELKELPIPPELLERFDTLSERIQREALQAAADRVIPDRRDQGPVFLLGETLEIRGGRFRVFSLNPKKGTITLQSLPRRATPRSAR